MGAYMSDNKRDVKSKQKLQAGSQLRLARMEYNKYRKEQAAKGGVVERFQEWIRRFNERVRKERKQPKQRHPKYPYLVKSK